MKGTAGGPTVSHEVSSGVTTAGVAAGNVLYIDLVGDTAPFQVVNAAIAGVLADIVAGTKLALFYNYFGIPVGVMALSMIQKVNAAAATTDRKSTRLNSSHLSVSRMPSSA